MYFCCGHEDVIRDVCYKPNLFITKVIVDAAIIDFIDASR